MCEYTGLKDPQRHDPSRFQTVEQFTHRMKRITIHPAPEWDVGGLEAFNAKHPAPKVSPFT